MTSPVRKIMFATAVGVATTFVTADHCEAGLFDWLFGRPPAVVYPAQPVVAYPAVPVAAPVYAAPVATPAVAVAPAAQTTYYAPTYRTVVNYPAAATAPAIPAAVAPAVVAPAAVAPVAVAPAAQPVVVGYAPTYRTHWLRVPVTYYRPVTGYTVAGYPTVAATPCNTYAWQAQRIPTILHRPLLPHAPVTAPVTYGYAPAVAAPVTYGYAPAPATIQVAPAAPAAVAPAVAPSCQACPSAASAAPTYYGSTPSVGAPPSGAVQSSTPVDNTTPVPASGIAPAADEAPSLLPGSFPSSSSAPNFHSAPTSPAVGSARPPLQIPTGSASAQQQPDSLYRVTPIPAPDVRTFDQRKAPSAPPLLQGRERTVSNQLGQTTVVENASWKTAKPEPQVKPAPSSKSAPLWNDSGWKN